MYGYSTQDERVRTLILLSLIGDSGKEVLKDLGIQAGKRIVQNAIDQIPGKVLIEINKRVGFRPVTKSGARGVINLTKAISLLGGFLSGAIDATACYTVGKTAKSIFAAAADGGADEAHSTVP